MARDEGADPWAKQVTATNGSSSRPRIVSTDPKPIPAPVRPISTATSAGVRTMPGKLEKDAPHTAAATLPRAIAVKATDDWTVDGNSVRNSIPAASGPGKARDRSRPTNGNTIKVEASTAAWSRAWPRPATIASRGSLAP